MLTRIDVKKGSQWRNGDQHARQLNALTVSPERPDNHGLSETSRDRNGTHFASSRNHIGMECDCTVTMRNNHCVDHPQTRENRFVFGWGGASKTVVFAGRIFSALRSLSMFRLRRHAPDWPTPRIATNEIELKTFAITPTTHDNVGASRLVKRMVWSKRPDHRQPNPNNTHPPQGIAKNPERFLPICSSPIVPRPHVCVRKSCRSSSNHNHKRWREEEFVDQFNSEQHAQISI